MSKLIVIPARGGSKRIPNKNIRLFNGKPLIQWTIESAIESKISDNICVSTDSNEIADLAIRLGAEAPFIRPEKLSNDYAKSIDVVLHSLEHYKEASEIFLLQPTSPLRTASHIKDFYKCVESGKAAAAASIYECSHSPLWTFTLKQNKLKRAVETNIPIDTRSQDLPKYYMLNGAIYFSFVETIMRTNSFIHEETIGVEMPSYASVDIDNEVDWDIAEMLAQKYLNL